MRDSGATPRAGESCAVRSRPIALPWTPADTSCDIRGPHRGHLSPTLSGVDLPVQRTPADTSCEIRGPHRGQASSTLSGRGAPLQWTPVAMIRGPHRGRASPRLSGVDLPLQRTLAATLESTYLYSGHLRLRVAIFAGHTAGGTCTKKRPTFFWICAYIQECGPSLPAQSPS